MYSRAFWFERRRFRLGWYTHPANILSVLVVLTLALAVACGGSPAAPDPTAAPATESTGAMSGEAAQPTSAPQPAAPPAGVEVNPGKLTIMIGDLGTERFDPAVAGGAGGTAQIYARNMGGYLISDNETRSLVPGIAEDWGLSADGLTWTFTIRDGVKFHDGSDLTPEDVLWTFQHYFGPEAIDYATTSLLLMVSRAHEAIELSGSNTVSLTTQSPITPLATGLSSAGNNWLHILPKRDEVHNVEVELAYDNEPIGAGAMQFVDRVPASVMQFERFDDFYYQPDNGFAIDKRVNFQWLDLFVVGEEATRVAALRSGEADIVPASLTTQEQVEAAGGRLVMGQEGILIEARLLGCWEEQHPCHDKRVRQALEYAIDKELVQNQLYGGPEFFQIKGWFAVTPSTISYTPELDPYPFDPDKARQLLAEAGYPGGEGFGKFIVNTNPAIAMPFLVESAQATADVWKKELGIDVEVRVGDRVGVEKRLDLGELNGQMLWADNDTRISADRTLRSNYGGLEDADRTHSDPELAARVHEVTNIVDQDEREQAVAELMVELRRESYMLGVGYANIPWGVGPRVLTWEPYPLAGYPSALHTITLK